MNHNYENWCVFYEVKEMKKWFSYFERQQSDCVKNVFIRVFEAWAKQSDAEYIVGLEEICS